MTSRRFEIDPDPIQLLSPTDASQRFEGVDFSSSGGTLAVATADTNDVLLFRRRPDGRFEDKPYARFGAPESQLSYPHDVAFSRSGKQELLAIAQRTGAIVVYAKDRESDSFAPQPICEIAGPNAELDFSDGVAFVPPYEDHLAACNLNLNTITFYPRLSQSPLRFAPTPAFQLKHRSIVRPDGLAFSSCGRWLAVANHGGPSVSVFPRNRRLLTLGTLAYGPEPVTVIDDPTLRFPHSVAFAPKTNHLVVTNAGSNYFNVYAPIRRVLSRTWTSSPVQQCKIKSEEEFRQVNASNKMEGGPKGIAIHGNRLAVCSPELGVKIYALHSGS